MIKIKDAEIMAVIDALFEIDDDPVGFEYDVVVKTAQQYTASKDHLNKILATLHKMNIKIYNEPRGSGFFNKYL